MLFRILVLTILCLGLLSTDSASAQAPQKAIATEETAVVGNGATLGTIQPGASVIILGESATGEEYIVQHLAADGKKIIGMAAKKSLVLTKEVSSLQTATNQVTPPPVVSAVQNSQAEVMNVLDFAQLAKSDPASFKQKYQGRTVKVFGAVEKATMENLPGAAGMQPVVTLATTSSLPRVKVKLSPSIAKDANIISHYRYFPSWFYGYYGRKLEFRQSGANQIQVRASYRYSSAYSGGYSSSSKHSSSWSPIFSPGDPLTVEGFVKGVGLDIELHGGFLIRPSKNQ